MRGYHNLPAATAEVLSPDGWPATGDVGELDDVGRLRITNRKKDLIKTSGGKYIAPQAVEVLFKAVCPLASQMTQWGTARALSARDYVTLAADPSVPDYVQACVDPANTRLNRWETIKDFRILERDLSIESGELTPSTKVRRRVVEASYGSLLESMYPA